MNAIKNRHTFISIFILCLFCSSVLRAQRVYDIKNPGENRDELCQAYDNWEETLPNGVRMGIHYVDRDIYLGFNSREYFDKLFSNPKDGFAIDIIQREQYACGGPNKISESWAQKGSLMKPLYQKDFKPEPFFGNDNGVMVKYGELPKQFDQNTVELNLVILKERWKCGYTTTINIDFGQWSLLEMGLYRDSIRTEEVTHTQFEEIKKTVNFTVPFAKNQTTFEQEDVQPIYDTLNLTDCLH